MGVGLEFASAIFVMINKSIKYVFLVKFIPFASLVDSKPRKKVMEPGLFKVNVLSRLETALEMSLWSLTVTRISS